MVSYDDVMAAEDGDIDGLQAMIDAGQWSLQGSFGRAMMAAIEDGRAILGPAPARDYWGNRIPAWYEVEAGTKGSPDYAAAHCDCGKGSACPLTLRMAAPRLLDGLVKAHRLTLTKHLFDGGLTITVRDEAGTIRARATREWGDDETAAEAALASVLDYLAAKVVSERNTSRA